MKDDIEKASEYIQQSHWRHSSPTSPLSSRPASQISLRSRSKPNLIRHHSSLADIAREHKLHSRPSSTNDIRKFFINEEEGGLEAFNDDLNDDIDDEFVLLPRRSSDLINDSPENPTSRTVPSPMSTFVPSRLHYQWQAAGQSDGEESVRSRSSSRASSTDSETERLLHLHVYEEIENIDEDDSWSSQYKTLWEFVLKNMLNFDLSRPSNADDKQQRREKTTSVFDPALALALFTAFVR